MARVIAVANQKGGVGKTTTAVTVACGLRLAGQRLLLVDADPQGNATTSLAGEKGAGTAEALREPTRAAEFCQRTAALVDLLAGTWRLREVDADLARGRMAGDLFARALAGLASSYDFVLIDCPPALSGLALGAVGASGGVLVPVQPEFLSLEGLAQMKETLERIRNGPILFGILLTQVATEEGGVVAEVRAEIDRFFPSARFSAEIVRDGAIGEAPGHGRSLFAHAPRAVGTYRYARLVGEILRRATILSGETTGSRSPAPPPPPPPSDGTRDGAMTTAQDLFPASPLGPLSRRLRAIRFAYGTGAGLALSASAGALLAELPSPAAHVSASTAFGLFAAGWAHVASTRRREQIRRPVDADSALAQGIATLMAGNPPAAEEIFREIGVRFPRDAETAFYLGVALRDQGNRAAARRAFSRAIRIDLDRKWTREIQALRRDPLNADG